MEKELKAFAIGPDRFEVIVGYDKESVIEWYKKETGISEEDFKDYDVRLFPMDKEVDAEEYGITTVEKLVKDVNQFPCLVCWCED